MAPKLNPIAQCSEMLPPLSLAVSPMIRLFITMCLVLPLGCSEPGDPRPQAAANQVEDGGGGKDAHREQCEQSFLALKQVQSAEEEKELLQALSQWLNKHGYQIQVKQKDNQHILTCPYFPPVTPLTEHTFLDQTNLDLLPQSPKQVG